MTILTKSRLSPQALKSQVPLGDIAYENVTIGRQEIIDGLSPSTSGDDRLVVMIGPCSIHDPIAALEYGKRLCMLKQAHENDLTIVMRVYVEKPRTTVGWKGMAYDPDMNDTSDMAKGLLLTRSLMVKLAEQGLPIVTEVLSPLIVPFFDDCLSSAVIGARTTESQIHRELASSLDVPVGFKNGTDGSVAVAIEAMTSAAHPHNFLTASASGHVVQEVSKGNADCFAILRGGRSGPSIYPEHIEACADALAAKKQPVRIMVDCSHGNSSKDYRNQAKVAAILAEQYAAGAPIAGVMLESNIKAGRQDIPASGPAGLEYGVSVTDGCIGWTETEDVLDMLASAVRARRINSVVTKDGHAIRNLPVALQTLAT